MSRISCKRFLPESYSISLRLILILIVDIMFNLEKVYYILDEMVVNGYDLETVEVTVVLDASCYVAAW